MAQGKAEDAGGLTPAKDDNTALWHFGHRTLPIFKCVDYIAGRRSGNGAASSLLHKIHILKMCELPKIICPLDRAAGSVL